VILPIAGLVADYTQLWSLNNGELAENTDAFVATMTVNLNELFPITQVCCWRGFIE